MNLVMGLKWNLDKDQYQLTKDKDIQHNKKVQNNQVSREYSEVNLRQQDEVRSSKQFFQKDAN
jgi:hypothetical protein